MKRPLNIGILALALIYVLVASAHAGTVLNPSLYAFGARQIGMGRATLGDKGDPNNIFSNPASIDFSKYWQISATSSNLLGDINQNTAAASFKTGFGTIGIGFVGLSAGGSFPTVREPSVTGRIILDPSAEAIGYDNNILVLSFAKRIEFAGDLSLGASLKNYNQSISGPNSSARGTATDLDIGLLYCPESLPWLSAGFAYQNLLSSPLSWSGASTASDRLGGAMKIGGQFRLSGKGSLLEDRLGENDIVGALDMEMPRDPLSSSSGTLFRAGIEWKPAKTVALRLGYDQSAPDSPINYGIGLEQSQFRFDYAYKADPFSSNNSHIFTLSYFPEPEKPRAAKKKGAYAVKISSPADKTSVTEEALAISGSVENAHELSALKINGRYVMALSTANSFEAHWPTLEAGANVLSIEVFVSSPEAGSASAALNILRAPVIEDVAADSFAKDPIAHLNNLGIMRGYSDGTFRPEQNINRAELVTLLVKARGHKEPGVTSRDFKDVPVTYWAAGFASIAAKEGLVKGYPDGTFKPAKNVSMAEAAVIISRFSGASLEPVAVSPFTDVAIDNWAVRDIDYAKKKGMLDFVVGTGLEPNRNITRGEVAYMLSKTPLIQSSIEAVFSSLPTGEPAAKGPIDLVPLPQSVVKTYYRSVLTSAKISTSEVKDVSINGKRLRLAKGSASFSETIGLAAGSNTVEVKAIGLKDEEIYRLERRIIRF